MERVIFSARGLVLGLGLLLAAAPGLLPPLRAADAWLYQRAAALIPAPPGSSVVLAQFDSPAGDAADWLAGLAADLPALKGARSAALILPARWLPALQWTAAGRRLRARLSQLGVHLGVSDVGDDGWQGGYPVLDRQAGLLDPLLTRLPGTAWLYPPERLRDGSDAAPVRPAYPVAGGLPAYPLVWHGERALHADLAAVLVAQLRGGRAAGPWREHGRLGTGASGVPTDATGRVMVPAARVVHWRWGQANAPSLDGRAVVVAPRGSGDALAAATAALAGGRTAFVPVWAGAAAAVLVVLIALYCAFLLPRLSLFAGAALSLLVLVAVLGGELGAFLRNGLWMGWSAPLAMLLGGYPLALVARAPQRRLDGLALERERVLRRLAAYQVEAGEYEEAFATLQRCAVVEEVLELVYRCATALERKRRYEQAADMLTWIAERRPGYKDVDRHLQSLEANGATIQAGQTLVMSGGDLVRPLIGRYEVVREIGRGATGVVYLGRDPKIGREVAIKTLAFSQFDDDELDTFKARFGREAEAAGRLSHPNIVTVYDVGEEKDLAFIAMDYAPGRTLAAYTTPRALLPVPEVLQVLAQVAEALAYAHEQGIVHRDIKPANIIYDAGQARVKVTDFGIARVMDSSRTRTGSILGTPSYMAPEQLTGDRVDGRTDLFSLGVTLYQLLTGEVPFAGENLAGIAYQITSVKQKGVRTLRPDLPAALPRIVNRALQKSPDKRYQDAAEMAEALFKAAGRSARERRQING